MKKIIKKLINEIKNKKATKKVAPPYGDFVTERNVKTLREEIFRMPSQLLQLPGSCPVHPHTKRHHQGRARHCMFLKRSSVGEGGTKNGGKSEQHKITNYEIECVNVFRYQMRLQILILLCQHLRLLMLPHPPFSFGDCFLFDKHLVMHRQLFHLIVPLLFSLHFNGFHSS